MPMPDDNRRYRWPSLRLVRVVQVQRVVAHDIMFRRITETDVGVPRLIIA